ncbi:uncharacterized protein LOC128953984 [Oppia nitens]|uniref:uncharacterized protein LOC128953984 n=1 Tax=Oppia nitens TaxID=1686743 RepID=UPI0023DB0F1A|nr:uncharacterized protein LOC128953984 [Oppia nitens]
MFTIRKAVKDDCPILRQLIQGLAAYHKLNTVLVYPVEQLEEQGFSDQPSKQLFQALVAQSTDSKQQLVGYIIYFMTYSAFNGKVIQMEELYVREEYRGCGLGRTLMRELAKEAIQLSVGSIEWDCMSNNESSILFYKRLGGKDLADIDGIHMYSLKGDKLKQLVNTCDSDGHQCLTTIIREATKEDSCVLRQLTQEFTKEVNMIRDVVSEQDLIDNGLSNGCDSRQLFQVFIADSVDSGQPIGYIFYCRAYSPWNGTGFWIRNLYVRPEYRQKGLAQHLMAAVAKRAISESRSHLYWRGCVSDAVATSLYNKLEANDLTANIGLNLFSMSADSLAQLAT